MQIGTHKALKRAEGTVTLKGGEESIEIKVVPLPMGWGNKMLLVGVVNLDPPPQVPLKNRDNTVAINANTGRAETVPNHKDPKYLRTRYVSMLRQDVMTAYAHISEDESVSFSATEPKGDDKKEWCGFADAIASEFRNFGILDSDIASICDAGASLEMVIDLEEGSKDFLPDQETTLMETEQS